MANIIGLNPEDWAKNQVDLRQQLLGLEKRDAEVLSWMNSKTSWIRASSSVTISKEKSKELTNSDAYAGRALAKEFVLFNGTTSVNNEDLNPIQKSGIASSNSIINNNIYGFGGIGYTGIVPMPGIKKLDIQTYRRGSLRKANFSIKAYNREQFAILDALYMRPGYTILLEWGHTSYFTGTPENPTYTHAEFDTVPFNKLMKQELDDSKEGGNNYTQDSILADIINERIESDGNYDGFFGKITNFDWKFNNDGTYDITLSAISTGDVIESLTINRTLPTFSSPKVDTQIGVSRSNPNRSRNAGNGKNRIYVDKNSSLWNGEDYSVLVPTTDSGYYRGMYWEYWNCKGNNGYAELNSDDASTQSKAKRHRDTLEIRARDSKKSKAFKGPTLKPPAAKIAKPTPVGPDTLLVQRDKSELNKWLYDIYNELKSSSKTRIATTSAGSEGNTRPKTVYVSYIDGRGKDCVMYHTTTTVEKTSGVSGMSMGTATVASANAPYQYVTLSNILSYIQTNLLIYTKSETSYINIDFDENSNFCYTFPDQFSSDPLVCAIPFKTRDANDPLKISGEYWEDILGTAFKTKSDFVGNMMNIHVNVHYVASVLDRTTKNNGVILLDFLKQLMHGIQVALGSVNKFSVIYDHDENIIRITDDVPLDPKIVGTKVTREKRTLLNVYGYDKGNQNGSFIKDVGISATLSNNFATMISIGAQSRSTSDIADGSAFAKWNTGLQDVVFPSKLSKGIADKDAENTKSPFELFKENIVSLKKKGNVIMDFYYSGKEPSKDAIASTKSLNAGLAKYLGTYYNKENNVPSIQGFIPFNMNLKMEGFSGFRIYEKFYITTEILPPSYPENLSFIIKGLRHSIDERGWQTSIESLSVQSVDGESVLEVPQNVIDSLKS